jgi:hypothetical protein
MDDPGLSWLHTLQHDVFVSFSWADDAHARPLDAALGEGVKTMASATLFSTQRGLSGSTARSSRLACAYSTSACCFSRSSSASVRPAMS